MNLPNHYDHGSDQICIICGETIAQIEHESSNAEKTDQGFICWDCQNQKPIETLKKFGLLTD